MSYGLCGRRPGECSILLSVLRGGDFASASEPGMRSEKENRDVALVLGGENV